MCMACNGCNVGEEYHSKIETTFWHSSIQYTSFVAIIITNIIKVLMKQFLIKYSCINNPVRYILFCYYN